MFEWMSGGMQGPCSCLAHETAADCAGYLGNLQHTHQGIWAFGRPAAYPRRHFGIRAACSLPTNFNQGIWAFRQPTTFQPTIWAFRQPTGYPQRQLGSLQPTNQGIWVT